MYIYNIHPSFILLLYNILSFDPYYYNLDNEVHFPLLMAISFTIFFYLVNSKESVRKLIRIFYVG